MSKPARVPFWLREMERRIIVLGQEAQAAQIREVWYCGRLWGSQKLGVKTCGWADAELTQAKLKQAKLTQATRAAKRPNAAPPNLKTRFIMQLFSVKSAPTAGRRRRVKLSLKPCGMFARNQKLL